MKVMKALSILFLVCLTMISSGCLTINVNIPPLEVPDYSKQSTKPEENVNMSSQKITESSKQLMGGIENVLDRTAKAVLEKVPQRSRIAIVYITAPDRAIADYITGELEYIWVKEGYTITDRSQLDRLRQEQNLQLSSEVDDATAVSIGKFSGADIVVTGRVDGEGNLRRLRLRALDTQTAQVVGVASERL